MDTIKFKNGNTKVIAHRGCSGLECENSTSAFVAAGMRTYYGIESDVHCTADGQYLIFHDDNTARMTDKDFVMEQTDAKTLMSLTLKDKDGTFERRDLVMPTLTDYFKICKRYEKIAVLELKNPIPPQHIAAIVAVARDMGYFEQTVFISFYPENVIALRQMEPTANIQFLSNMELTDEIIGLLEQYKVDLDIEYHKLDAEKIQKLHARGITVNCWTCDDRDAAEQLAAWGIDYITTNILEGE